MTGGLCAHGTSPKTFLFVPLHLHSTTYLVLEMPSQRHADPIGRYIEIFAALLSFYLWHWRTDIHDAVWNWILAKITGREQGSTR